MGHVEEGVSDNKVFGAAYFEKEVADNVNGLANYYEKQKIGSIEVADRLEYITDIQRGRSNVLEVGCAFGQTVMQLRHRGYPAYGCDISEYSVTMARTRHTAPVFVADLESTAFLDTVREQTAYPAFDLLFSCITLEHIHPENVPDVIARLYALTKPGGTNYHAIDLFKGDDITHYCIMPREWWMDRFIDAGFIPMPVSAEGVRLNWFLFKKQEAVNG